MEVAPAGDGGAGHRRGRLHVYLGAAPGAGKTYALLAEGHRLAAAGSDVVVGLAETHGRADTETMLRALERLPPRQVSHHGAAFDELDVDALLARHPAVALVAELAHPCVPGGRPRILGCAAPRPGMEPLIRRSAALAAQLAGNFLVAVVTPIPG